MTLALLAEPSGSPDSWLPAILLAIIVSIVAPTILSVITGAQAHRAEQRRYAREDIVAEKAEARAAAAAEKAAEVANQLLANDEVVKHRAEKSLEVLNTIHTLVNSNMTAAMQSELDETRRGLVLMRELVEHRRANGQEPNAETVAEIDVQVAKVADLEATLAARHAADREAERQKLPPAS